MAEAQPRRGEGWQPRAKPWGQGRPRNNPRPEGAKDFLLEATPRGTRRARARAPFDDQAFLAGENPWGGDNNNAHFFLDLQRDVVQKITCYLRVVFLSPQKSAPTE